MSANVEADREVTYAERQTIRTLLANYQRELNTPPLKPGCALYLTPDVLRVEKRIMNGRVFPRKEIAR